LYLRDELLFDFDEDGIVNTPMSFEIVEVVELRPRHKINQNCWASLIGYCCNNASVLLYVRL